MASPRPCRRICGWCSIGLLECLENDLLFVRGNADAGVAYGKSQDRFGLRQVSLSGLQPCFAGTTCKETFAISVNLKAFEKQILRICCSRLASVSTASADRDLQDYFSGRSAMWLAPGN